MFLSQPPVHVNAYIIYITLYFIVFIIATCRTIAIFTFQTVFQLIFFCVVFSAKFAVQLSELTILTGFSRKKEQ